MKTQTVLFALAVILTGFAMQPADALSRSCIRTQYTPTSVAPTPTPVVGTLNFVLPGACPFGGDYHVSGAATPACFAVGPQPGEYCGPIIPSLGAAICHWSPVINTVTTVLYVGFDIDGDGHVFHPSGEVVFGPFKQGPPSWVVVNPHSVAGRVIAYPTNIGSTATAPADINLVTCV